MDEIGSVSEAVELLASSYLGAGVVGIDGTLGVGKTTFAKELGASIGATVVCLDNFVTKNRETYVPNLRTGELASVISSAGRPVIVEGVCLLAALEAVSIEADVLIYVKRVGAHGYWDDQDTCDPEEDEEALISRLSQETAAFAKLISPQLAEESAAEEGVGLAPLREEIIRYHCKHRPSRKAQIALLSAA